MTLCSHFLVVLLLLCAFSIGLLVDFLLYVPPLPVVEDTNWGNRNGDGSIRPFRINISEEHLEDLRHRLTHIRPIRPNLANSAHSLGPSNQLMNKILDHWLHKYNWRQREKLMNKHPQFITEIQGLDIHFVHIKPKIGKKVIPILLLHGFPGSFNDFSSMIPHLTNDNKYEFNFEIIIPSLPGYGFSDYTNKTSFAAFKIGGVLRNLMKRMGHEQFYIVGQDIGVLISKDMATLFPKNVLGIYLQLSVSTRYISMIKYGIEWLLPEQMLSDRSKYTALDALYYFYTEGPYFHFQLTKADVLSMSFNESPLGWATYVVHLLSSGSNIFENIYTEDAGLDIFSYDDILDNIMLYWLTGSIRTSMRYCQQWSYDEFVLMIPISPDVPCSVPKFEDEIFYYSEWILKDTYTNIIQRTEFNHGHFALLEKNETIKALYAEDIFSSVKKSIDFRESIKG